MANHLHDAPPEPGARRFGHFARAYLAALLSADLAAAESTIRDALDAKLSAAQINEDVIAPALRLIGELWERGEISVAEEHVATEISLRILALEQEAQRVARARGGHKVMLATPPGELHTVALRMVDSLVVAAGYDVLMLGADVPAHAIGVAVRCHRPDAICLSATIPGRTEHVLGCIDEAQLARASVGVVLGGRGITVEGQLRPAVDVCTRVSEAVEAVDAVVKRARSN